MSEATPVVTTPPVVPPATPSNQPETVTLDKATHDQLLKDAARAGEAQSRGDRYENILKKNGLLGGSGHFKPANPATPPTPEERQAAAVDEDRKAEKGLLGLALDPVYREVLDKDPTLRDLLTKNPLAVLPILAPDALDADDAVSLVRDALIKRKASPATPPANPPTPPATPPPGAISPQDTLMNEEVELARKNPNTNRAISGMIGARLKGSVKK